MKTVGKPKNEVVVGFRRKRGQKEAYPITRSVGDMNRKHIIANSQRFRSISPLQKRKDAANLQAIQVLDKRLNQLVEEGLALEKELDGCCDDVRAEQIRTTFARKTRELERLMKQKRLLQESTKNVDHGTS